MTNRLNDRNWTVLLIGGASGTGKSSIAYGLGKHYQVNVMEIDDIHLIVKNNTTLDTYPGIHYWETGVNWLNIGEDGNFQWLKAVSKELAPSIKALAERHIEDEVPIIIEGDFLDPDLASLLTHPRVKMVIVNEPDHGQIIENYLAREGGQPQTYRATISTIYNNWLVDQAGQLGIATLDARPWETAIERIIAVLKVGE